MRFVMRRSDFSAAQSASGSPVLSSALSAELCRAGRQAVMALHTQNPVMQPDTASEARLNHTLHAFAGPVQEKPGQ